MRTFSLVVMAGVTLAVAPLACSSAGDDLFPSSGASSSMSASSMSGSSSAMGGSSSTTSGASSAMGGASSATGGSSSATGGSSSTGSTTDEDCSNGVDDDGNGLIDCADPGCSAGFVCEDAPSPWKGPVILYEGPQGTSPMCPASYPMLEDVGFVGLHGDDAICTDCGCDAPPTTCTPAALELALVTCAVPTATISQSTNCAAFSSAMKNLSANEPAIMSAGNKCMPTGGDATVPHVDYDTEAVVCGEPPALGGGCATGQACAQRPPAPFESTLCVVRDGDHSCPNDYPNKHAYVTNWSDDRGCSTCECGDLDPASCSAVTSLYSDASCANEVDSFDDDGSCETLDNTTTPASFKVTLDLVDASCDVSDGGDPIGGITTTGSITVCCQ